MWGAGLGLCVQGKPGAAKGRVVLAGGLVAERGFDDVQRLSDFGECL